MWKVVFLSVVFISKLVLGAEIVEIPDGTRVTLDKCRMARARGSVALWSTLLECPDPERDGKMVFHNLGDGKSAIHIKFSSGSRGGFLEYVLVGEKSQPELKTIWRQKTGLLGDIGERITPGVRFEDLTGDGYPEIVTGTESEAVFLCGKKERPLLFRRVYDWDENELRPVIARRMGLGKPSEVNGSLLPGNGPTKPIVDQIVPLSASRMAGDRGDPILLSPPVALVDRNPKTVWTPVPENGAGEFVTLKTLAHAYGVTRVGVRPLPEGKNSANYDRPRSLLLSTEEKLYRLVFPLDPLESPDKDVWFDLPSPIYSRCFSIIVESTYSRSPQKSLAIAEVALITEADGKGGLDRLAGDLNSREKRRQAAMLLERAGQRSVPALRSLWSTLNAEGKRLGIGVLANTDPRGAADLLTEAAVAGTAEQRQSALVGVAKAGDAAVPTLKKYLAGQDDGDVLTAGQILASLGTTQAFDALAALVGKGGRKRRVLLRKHLRQMGRNREDLALRLLALAQNAEKSGNKEALLDLLRAGATIPRVATGIAPIADALYSPQDDFADRYRLLEVFEQLECHGNREHLVMAASDGDHLIRALALRGLSGCFEHRAITRGIAEKSLADPAFEVRLAALKALKRIGAVSDYEDGIGGLAKGDPWPEIRALCTDLSGQFRPPRTLEILSKTKVDASPIVRMATLRVAAKLKGKEADQIVEGFLANDREQARLKAVAAGVVAFRCQKSAIPALFSLLKRGAEPLAEKGEIDVAVASARALGKLGGEQAARFLNKAKKRSNPGTDRAIAEALAILPSSPCTPAASEP